MEQYDICIIGAGASGMAAALTAASEDPALRVLVLDKNPEPGKKLRATGSGRCNITNTAAPGYAEARNFLLHAGIALRTYPNGLVYPYSESAADVADILADKMAEAGVRLKTAQTVTGIRAVNNGYEVELVSKDHREMAVTAPRLIVAAGGKAGPNYGTTGDAYRWLTGLGHHLIPPIPVLTPVECAGDSCEGLSGTRAKGTVTLYRRTIEGEENRILPGAGGDAPDKSAPCARESGTCATVRKQFDSGCRDEAAARTVWNRKFEEYGEIQFTRTGLSGICVFNMTRYMRFDRKGGIRDFEIGIDLCPDLDLRDYLERRRAMSREMGKRHVSRIPGSITSSIKRKDTTVGSIEVEPSRAGHGRQGDHRKPERLSGRCAEQVAGRNAREESIRYEDAGTAASILRTVFRSRLAEYILNRSGIKPDRPIAGLTDEELNRIARNSRDLRFHPTGIRGWKDAQCTSGGIDRDEIREDTAESLLHPGLYITGELQDYDGPCGGYNLTHAWITGMAAGRAAAAR